MPVDSQTLQQAVTHHQSGDLVRAETLYRDIVRVDPNHADALHLLGVVAIQQNQHETAVERICQAIKVHRSSARYYSNLGVAYQGLNRFDDAAECFREAIRIDEEYVDAHFNLGNVFVAQGQLKDAAEKYGRVLEIQPDFETARFNLANVCFLLGNEQLGQGDQESAIESYRRAIRLRANFSDAYTNLGNAFKELGQISEATEAYRRAISIQPDFAEAYVNYGAAIADQGMYAEAVDCYDRALEIIEADEPGNDSSESNVVADASFNRSLVHLVRGEFATGWNEYEWRWKCKARPRRFSEPEWDGSSLEGKTILVYAEQGVGDEIMFASCLPDVIERAGQCIVECDPRLVPIFARSFPSTTVVATLNNGLNSNVLPRFDCRIAVGSLSRFLRGRLSEFPRRRWYLTPDPKLHAKWQSRFRYFGNSLKVGFSWRGGKEPDIRQMRSTNLEQWSSLFSTPGVSFINLQYGDCKDELQEIQDRQNIKIHDWPDADPLKNLDNFAAEVACLDLVISVSNAGVHLAGALGVPTWTLLPFAPNWRWMLDRDDSPWYSTMRLFRQHKVGEWGPVFDEVTASLAELKEPDNRRPVA